MAAKIRTSPIGEQLLLDLQANGDRTQQSPQPVTLILDNATRWNSQALMLQRALRLEPHLQKLKQTPGVPAEVAEAIPERAVFKRVGYYFQVYCCSSYASVTAGRH